MNLLLFEDEILVVDQTLHSVGHSLSYAVPRGCKRWFLFWPITQKYTLAQKIL